jgi:SET domain-containing protein
MYKPLPSFLTIKKSTIHGLGLFTEKDLFSDIVLGITHIRDERFEDGYIRTPLGGFFNSSQNPNCEVIHIGDFILLKTIKDIEAFEELTASYTLYEI